MRRREECETEWIGNIQMRGQRSHYSYSTDSYLIASLALAIAQFICAHMQFCVFESNATFFKNAQWKKRNRK